MININLSEKEVELLKKSINHCLDTCEDNKENIVCSECEALKTVLVKLSQ